MVQQSRRLAWLLSLGASALVLRWSAGALDATASGRRSSAELIVPVLTTLASLAGCVGCLSYSIRRHSAARSRAGKAFPGGIPRGGGAASSSGEPAAPPPSSASERAWTVQTPRARSASEDVMRSTKDDPPTREEAQMAREIMDAAFLDHSGPLPGAMPDAQPQAQPEP